MYTYPSVQKNISTEIVVVGGGITGALTSHALMEKGYKVTLIDKRDIGQGSSSATTSMLQYEIDVPYSELSNMIELMLLLNVTKRELRLSINWRQLVKEKRLIVVLKKGIALYCPQ
ncbi:MAG: FAD-binding oxidoreductase [Saprospiraceae bacterium]|nr:FAD-binding oxidoreductase [Saprospiraceae bacterium]